MPDGPPPATTARPGSSYPRGAGDRTLTRVRHVETLAPAPGEALLDVGAAVGFRAMGYFHVAPTAPWSARP
jgi:hypothetical protein